MTRAEKYVVLLKVKELTNSGRHKEANDLYLEHFYHAQLNHTERKTKHEQHS